MKQFSALVAAALLEPAFEGYNQQHLEDELSRLRDYGIPSAGQTTRQALSVPG